MYIFIYVYTKIHVYTYIHVIYTQYYMYIHAHTHINVGLKDLPKSHQIFGGWLRVSLDATGRCEVPCPIAKNVRHNITRRSLVIGGWITAPPNKKGKLWTWWKHNWYWQTGIWNAGLFEGLEFECFRCYSLHGKKKKHVLYHFSPPLN